MLSAPWAHARVSCAMRLAYRIRVRWQVSGRAPGRSSSRAKSIKIRPFSAAPLDPRSMALIVQKYGGTSVGSAERIKNVARRVAQWKARGHDLVIVVSAMSGETNRLIGLAK